MSVILNDDRWLTLLEHVAKHFNEVTLNRGYQYFKQQYVVSLHMTEDGLGVAKVNGTEAYKVSFNLERLTSSSCSCPVHHHCKHLAAAFMELADRHGYPASQIVNAKHQLLRLQAKPQVRDEAALQRLAGTDPEGWHAYFAEASASVRPAYDPATYIGELRRQLPPAPPALSRAAAMYYRLHVELFVFHRLIDSMREGSFSPYASFYLHRMFEGVQQLLTEPPGEDAAAGRSGGSGGSGVYGESPELLMQTLRYMRQRLAKETKLSLDYEAYTTMLQHWATAGSDTAEAELRELEALPNASRPLLAAEAYLLLLQARPEEAWAALERSGIAAEEPADRLLPFLQRLAAEAQWSTLVDWLQKTAPVYGGLWRRELQPFLRLWQSAMERHPEAEAPFWRLMEDLMPRSLAIIEEQLYDRRHWKLWLEVQLLLGQDPLQHRVSVLQPIEKEAPELLLPYYHQAIEQFVSLKHRDAYKSAVKLMKRLAKLYKKLKRQERWDRYLDGFLERYSRLRALQEEIKKGKLAE